MMLRMITEGQDGAKISLALESSETGQQEIEIGLLLPAITDSPSFSLRCSVIKFPEQRYQVRSK